jgi:hypothetical protein
MAGAPSVGASLYIDSLHIERIYIGSIPPAPRAGDRARAGITVPMGWKKVVFRLPVRDPGPRGATEWRTKPAARRHGGLSEMPPFGDGGGP